MPECVLDESNGFIVKPLEGRYLSIPIELRSEETGELKAPPAPLIVYIAKHSKVLDDQYRVDYASKKIPDLDLLVYISRNEEYPSE